MPIPISYFLYSGTQRIRKGDPEWTESIPMSRKHPPESESEKFTYGDYFDSVHRFLLEKGFDLIPGILSEKLRQEISLDDIREATICLKKHGELYHPARIDIHLRTSDAIWPFVLNLAVSESGKKTIEREFQLLRRLGADFPYAFIPEVFIEGRVQTNTGTDVRMFLGEWLNNFHEFHECREKADTPLQLVVWNPENKRFFLNEEQTKTLFRNVATILTSYYNAETFEHIYPWRHAAGDFVVSLDNSLPEVRLITVRDYTPIIHTDTRDEGVFLQAVLIFLLELTIWIRLDRNDGVGDIVWADDFAAEAAIEGFFQGLERNPTFPDLSETSIQSFAAVFKTFLSRCTDTEYLELFEAIVDGFDPKLPEIEIVRQHLTAHSLVVEAYIRRLCYEI